MARRLATAPRRPWPGRPVPVALVITELDVGGAERALVSLATGLDRSRWEPSVVALGPEGPMAQPMREQGIRVDCLGVDPRRPVRAVLRLAEVLRELRPELVQGFLFHANIASRLAAPMAGAPWVLGGIRVAERRKGWHLAVDRATTRLAAGSVCVSEGVRRFTERVGRIDPRRLVVIPNGIDPGPIDASSIVDRSAIGVPADATLALFVGRLGEQKGVPTLLEAASRVVEARPDWHLAIVGDGPERDRLAGSGASARIPDGRLHWLGRRDDVPGLLKASDLLVLPSRWEGMPNVVLEAMAARRAVVATAVEGTEDLVEPGRTGWLVPPGDPAALASALIEAAADRGRLAAFGEAGRARVERRFSQGAVVRAYEALWAGVLGLEWRSGSAAEDREAGGSGAAGR
ncbi:glycosyltransferase [Tautonia sociabilis]|uniref:Glycosyltransferase n=1 Tax=Tautonia sociabilis TaxID=2080755 RepID=A0A432MDU8_9BACT|nr:glycosyltransferase [Tautonia sociabilis]